jgi:hypothetical protein
MKLKNTWLLLCAAALMFGFIFAWERFVAGPARQPRLLLPGFNSREVTTIQIRVAGQPELLADHSMGHWRLTRPLACPANPDEIDALLSILGSLKPDAFLSAREIMVHPNSEPEFGFDAPQATIILTSASGKKQIILGALTAPGDQLFVEVVGIPGINLVSTNLLSVIPPKPSAWRDTALLNWESLDFDRVIVNQGARSIELQRNLTNKLWRLVSLQSRANTPLIDELLRHLRSQRAVEFVTDDPRADLDAYGLHTPKLEIEFARGTNAVASLQFGSPLPANTNLIYARSGGSDSVVAVPAGAAAPWRISATDLRDRHLVTMAALPAAIEVVGTDRFTLARETNNIWRVLPHGFVADTNVMNDFIGSLAHLEVVQFVKDVVIESDLTNYGLASPSREYVLKPATNQVGDGIIDILFGSTADDNIYARRADEDSVYAVRRAAFALLPAASWEFRDRRIWHFTEDEVASVVIEEDGRRRELLRQGTNTWTLAPGSFGIINTFAVEETVHRTGDLMAAFWTARGQVDRARFGFGDKPRRLVFNLKNGSRREIEFGGNAPSGFPYAWVTLDGEPWVFEFPWTTWQFIQSYLSIPVREL